MRQTPLQSSARNGGYIKHGRGAAAARYGFGFAHCSVVLVWPCQRARLVYLISSHLIPPLYLSHRPRSIPLQSRHLLAEDSARLDSPASQRAVAWNQLQPLPLPILSSRVPPPSEPASSLRLFVDLLP